MHEETTYLMAMLTFCTTAAMINLSMPKWFATRGNSQGWQAPDGYRCIDFDGEGMSYIDISRNVPLVILKFFCLCWLSQI